MKKQINKTEDMVYLKTSQHKIIYDVIFKGKEYTCIFYYNDDDCERFETKIFDRKDKKINDENLCEEIENFVTENINGTD